MASEVEFGEVDYGKMYRTWLWFINEGAGCDPGSGNKNDVDIMTSENIERVRTIGGHVVSPLAILAIKSSASLLAGATAVILQQVTGENVMTSSLADFANLSLGR
jgi:hypothetical protein